MYSEGSGCEVELRANHLRGMMAHCLETFIKFDHKQMDGDCVRGFMASVVSSYANFILEQMDIGTLIALKKVCQMKGKEVEALGLMN